MLTSGKLGFWGLVGLVFGLVVGVGIYNLPQNMATVASPGAVFISWIITGIGILPLVLAFKWLSNVYPQYNAGIYQYAQAGFGNYIGFNIAWGYWLCTAFSNVAYGVMLNDSCGAFIPSLLNHGWQTVVFGTGLIWVMFYIVSRGIKTAKIVNSLLALVKIGMLIFIITVLLIYFKLDLFESDMWEWSPEIGSITSQVKNTMMVTLFCFLGIEGAVMMSARAKKSRDVGKAGIAGFIISLMLYMAISLLSYGLLTRGTLSDLHNPSIAYILRDCCGVWAYWFVISAVIISLFGGWVAWTLVVAQVPYEASLVGILPTTFSKVNQHNMPASGLFASSIVMQIFLMIVVLADDVYLAALHITGVMVIPCYLFVGLFLIKKAKSVRMRIIGIIISLFCIWMGYSGGMTDMLMSSFFYLLGIGFFIKARKDNSPPDAPIFTKYEKWVAIILLVLSLISCLLIYENCQTFVFSST